MAQRYKEIETIDQLLEETKVNGRLEYCAFQDLDFTKVEEGSLSSIKFEYCIFMGCNIKGLSSNIGDSCVCFPSIEKPYNLFKSRLYSPSELYGMVDEKRRFDDVVYQHYLQKGKFSDDISETLARSLHDHSILNALRDFLSQYDEKDVVAIMGGHAMLRTEPDYCKVVFIAKRLTEVGKLLVSGGGPGAMEATHLGAWMAGRDDCEVQDALRLLSVAPTYKDEQWFQSALAVIEKYPQTKYKSLGIPTWLYGHEPSTPFATHIAKLFENALREDELLTIAKGGIVYSPGSAGTMQEIFQDAVQNHYLTFGYASPMVFLGVEYWSQTMPVYKLLKALSEQQRYKNLLLSLTDDVDDVVAILCDYY